MSTPSSELPLTEQVQHRVDERGISYITLNRPDVKNAISPDQRDRVIALLAAVLLGLSPASALEPVGQGKGTEFDAAWSPDGRWLAHTRISSATPYKVLSSRHSQISISGQSSNKRKSVGEV